MYNLGAHHFQIHKSRFSHIPGIKVLMPFTLYNAKELLISSIYNDNPFIFIEQKLLYNTKGIFSEKYYTIPPGNADIKKEGKNVTIAVLPVCYLLPCRRQRNSRKKEYQSEKQTRFYLWNKEPRQALSEQREE